MNAPKPRRVYRPGTIQKFHQERILLMGRETEYSLAHSMLLALARAANL